MPKTFPFKLGADPEFTIMCGIKVASAARTMPLLLKNNKSAVLDQMGYKVKEFGNIGWDGAEATGEVRPNPSNNIDELVTNLHGLFQATTKDINIFKLTTLSLRQPIGGHIHLEVSREISENSREIDKITRALSSFYLPLLLGENIISLNKRKMNNSYGSLNDHRENGKTIEYRCPSAEWLTTPKITKATFAYFGVVYNEILKNPTDFCKKYKDVMWHNKSQADALHQMILCNSAGMIKTLFNDINKHVKTFELYQDYKEEIQFITNPSAVIKEKKAADYDIITGWNLKSKQPTKRSLTNQKQLDNKTKNINLEELNELIPIQHNGDMNTEVFANELKKRIITLNWTPKKKYFIFGLRQGINDYLIFDKSAQIYTGKQMIKTHEDAKMVNDLFDKLNSKFSTEIRTTDQTDFLSQYILIGIPYDKRQKNDFKQFVEHIINIENGKLKGSKINANELSRTLENQNKEQITSTLENINIDIIRADQIMESTQEARIRTMQSEEESMRIQSTLNPVTN